MGVRTALAVSFLLAACGSSPTVQAVDAMMRERVSALESLRRAQREYDQRAHLPRVVATPSGTVVVDRARLEGMLEAEYVRLRLTYVNTTDRILDDIHLEFRVRDGLGAVRAREEAVLQMPLQYRFTPGNSYTVDIEVSTGGAHLSPGWDWEVGCRGVVR